MRRRSLIMFASMRATQRMQRAGESVVVVWRIEMVPLQRFLNRTRSVGGGGIFDGGHMRRRLEGHLGTSSLLCWRFLRWR